MSCFPRSFWWFQGKADDSLESKERALFFKEYSLGFRSTSLEFQGIIHVSLESLQTPWKTTPDKIKPCGTVQSPCKGPAEPCNHRAKPVQNRAFRVQNRGITVQIRALPVQNRAKAVHSPCDSGRFRAAQQCPAAGPGDRAGAGPALLRKLQ